MTHAKTTMALAAAASVLLGAAGMARADEKFTAQDRTFVVKTSQGNNAEIMTSQLALKKSGDKKVRMVANMLVKDHGKSEANLKQLAATYKMKLPPGTDPMHQKMYKMLEGMKGEAFDKAYMKGQVKDHYDTIAMFKKQMEKGNQTEVRSYAARWLPGIETHTTMITSVASNMGIKTATKTGMTPAKMDRMDKMNGTSSAPAAAPAADPGTTPPAAPPAATP